MNAEVIPFPMKPERIEDVWGRTEDLDPALVPYLVDTEFGKSLKHPLVFQIPLTTNAIANMHYRNKLISLERAQKQEDWFTYIAIHERPHRLDALLEVDDIMAHTTDGISPRKWAELVRYVWVDSENIWQMRSEWEHLFDTIDDPRLMMDPPSRSIFANLPNPVKVFRGCIKGLNEDGLSWTTDYEKAKWFAQRFATLYPNRGIVIEGKVQKRNVLAVIADRGENEVVVRYRNAVDITNTIRVN